MNEYSPRLPGVAAGRLITCEVHTTSDPDPTRCYWLRWFASGDPPVANRPIVLPRGSGPHEIHFVLHDDAGLGILFKAQPEDAFWATTARACPEHPGFADRQIEGGCVSDDRQTLTIVDRNQRKADIVYRLRFDPDPFTLDPIIRNGGTGAPTSWVGVALALGAVVLAAATFLALN